MKKRNFISSLLLGAMLIVTGCNSNKVDNNINSNQLETNIVENGIKIKQATQVESTATYGAQQFKYSVYPERHADDITYSLKYASGSTPAESVLKVTHDSSNQTITIECFKPFTSQATLKIYSSVKTSVSASVKVDFVEKLTLSSNFTQNEDSPLSLSPVVNTTDGSIKVDKSTSNESISWNDDFVNTIVDYFQTELSNRGISYADGDGYFEPEDFSIFVDDSLNYFFNNNYTLNEFLSTINITYLDDSIDYELNLALIDFDHYDMMLEDECWNNVIDYTYTCNGETYNTTYGLTIDLNLITANSITITDSSNIQF